jgi:hypothetical protein
MIWGGIHSMRIIRPRQAVVMVVSALVLVGVGCDSTQPDRAQTRTATLSLSTIAKLDVYDCYEVWLDLTEPPDGTPETFSNLFCLPPPTPFKVQSRAPWGYSLMISVIRAGTTTEEIIGSSVQPGDGIFDYISLTDYSDYQQPAPARDPVDNIYYLNPQQVTVGSAYYLAFVGIQTACVRGIASNCLGAPNILSVRPPVFDIDVGTGDTVIVRARKQPASQFPPGIRPGQETDVQLSAVLTVAGVPVETTGTPPTPTSSTQDGTGFSFSFTVQ